MSTGTGTGMAMSIFRMKKHGTQPQRRLQIIRLSFRVNTGLISLSLSLTYGSLDFGFWTGPKSQYIFLSVLHSEINKMATRVEEEETVHPLSKSRRKRRRAGSPTIDIISNNGIRQTNPAVVLRSWHRTGTVLLLCFLLTTTTGVTALATVVRASFSSSCRQASPGRLEDTTKATVHPRWRRRLLLHSLLPSATTTPNHDRNTNTDATSDKKCYKDILIHNKNGENPAGEIATTLVVSRGSKTTPTATLISPTMSSVWGRRTVLVSLASTVPICVAAATTSTFLVPNTAAVAATLFSSSDPLPGILLGQGQWQPYLASDDDEEGHNAVVLSMAPFCTYATRFLIRYDPSVQQWWRMTTTPTITPNGMSQSRETFRKTANHDTNNDDPAAELAFGRLAQSLARAFATKEPSMERLYDRFLECYWCPSSASTTTVPDPEVARQIALLFALLPPSLQPRTMLQQYYIFETQQRKQQQKQNGAQLNDTLDFAKSSLTNLLPPGYHLVQHPSQAYDVTTKVNEEPSYYFSVASRGFPQSSDALGYKGAVQQDNVMNDKKSVSKSLSSSLIDTPFGPFSTVPWTRELPTYTLGTYALLGLAGAMGCSLTHAIVIPLDVLKTRAQTDPAGHEPGLSSKERTSGGPWSMFNAGAKIVENEGIGALVLGAQATIVGYFWYGFSVYPTYTFLKRFLSSSSSILPLDYAMAHGNEIALVAGAGAAVVASLGLTPIEAARIRVVANPTEYKPLGLLGTLRVIATEQNNNCNDDDSHQSWKGWRNLYAGLPSLLTRQVVFGSIKFLAFERACDFLFAAGPFLREATWTTLAVSLVAGGWSGVISSVVSQPADSVLTYVSKQQGKTNKTIVLDPTFTANPNKNTGSNNINEYNNNLNLLDGARRIVDEDGPGALFRGLQSRCVWAGSIIAGQFLLYDVFRTVFGVSAVDLTQVFEITMEVSSVSQN